MTLEEKVEISKIIISYAIEKYGKIFATCSFGKDSRVIVDLCMKIDPKIKFVSIDTGYEFSETLEFADQLIAETGMNIEWARPSEEDTNEINNRYGDEFIKDGQYKCCAMKEPAIRSFVSSHDAWITGLRRDESESREFEPIIDKRKDIVKINPIAFWSYDDVWEYIKKNNLSFNPLYLQGYTSLGCEPCTKKSTVTERSGRFVGSGSDGQECGLHK